MNRVSAQLRSLGDVRNVELVARLDRVADAASRALHRWWQELHQLLKRADGSAAERRQRLLAHTGRLAPTASNDLSHHLGQVARWSYDHASRSILHAVPVKYFDAAMGTLREAEEPGWVDLFANSERRLQSTDMAQRLRDGSLNDDERRRLFHSLIFPPPPAGFVQQVVHSSPWQAWLSGRPGRDAVSIANVITQQVSAGRSPREIADTLRPLVNNVEADARRISRTVGQQIGNQMQWAAHEQLGDLVVGFQIHATLDQHTRPHHASRSGTIFYKEPRPGQPSVDQMPHPPREADGSMAWNCRCFLTPVLAPAPNLRTTDDFKPFSDAREQMVPDVLTYSDWWARADRELRQIVVGRERYRIVRDKLKFEPEWSQFLNADGSMASATQLRGEDVNAIFARSDEVNRQIAARRDLKATAATYGGLPSPDLVPPPPLRPLSPAVRTILSNVAETSVTHAVQAVERLALLSNREPEQIRDHLLAAWHRATLSIAFDPSRPTPAGDSVIDALLENPDLGNRFLVGTSGGATDPEARDRWERRNFGASASDLSPNERPRYGSAHWTTHVGLAQHYGHASIVLNRNAFAGRITLSPNDTCRTGPEDVASAENPINSLARNAQAQQAIGMPGGGGHSLYLEIQVWGQVPINRETVKEIRVSAMLAAADIAKIQLLASRLGIPVVVA